MEFPNLPKRAMWFVALPDRELGCITERLAAHASCRRDHVSGRPWLLGSWPAGHLTVGQATHCQTALLGWCSASTKELTRIAGRTADVAALDRELAAVRGNYHVLATAGGRARAQGTATGNRRVFHAELDGATVAADRADVLAWLVGAALDERAVALKLLDPSPPHPLIEATMWHGIVAVPPDHYLLLDADGRAHHIRWWQCPQPVLGLREGAALLREEFSAAVAARMRGIDTVSCDLSGGLDSTSVCFLAAQQDARLVAYTATGRDPADDDVAWARLAVAALPGVTHEVLPRERVPLAYQGITEATDPLDEPYDGLLDRAQALLALKRVAAHGSQLHLTGFGGDEVVESSPEHLHSLARSRPLLALARLREYHALSRWSLWTGLLSLARKHSYSEWLAEAAGQLTQPRPGDQLTLDWHAPLRLPPWVTEEAAELVRKTIVTAAREGAEPLMADYGRHSDLAIIRGGGYGTRLHRQMLERAEVPTTDPLLDDRVVDACLAVRPEEQTTPWSYKPLLVEAMRGVVPEASLRRTTKAEGSAEEAAGLRENRGELLALVEDSRLARLGLVDAERLRSSCRFSVAPSAYHESLQQTFSTEVWLRTFEGSRVCLSSTGRNHHDHAT